MLHVAWLRLTHLFGYVTYLLFHLASIHVSCAVATILAAVVSLSPTNTRECHWKCCCCPYTNISEWINYEITYKTLAFASRKICALLPVTLPLDIFASASLQFGGPILLSYSNLLLHLPFMTFQHVRWHLHKCRALGLLRTCQTNSTLSHSSPRRPPITHVYWFVYDCSGWKKLVMHEEKSVSQGIWRLLRKNVHACLANRCHSSIQQSDSADICTHTRNK